MKHESNCLTCIVWHVSRWIWSMNQNRHSNCLTCFQLDMKHESNCLTCIVWHVSSWIWSMNQNRLKLFDMSFRPVGRMLLWCARCSLHAPSLGAIFIAIRTPLGHLPPSCHELWSSLSLKWNSHMKISHSPHTQHVTTPQFLPGSAAVPRTSVYICCFSCWGVFWKLSKCWWRGSHMHLRAGFSVCPQRNKDEGRPS